MMKNEDAIVDKKEKWNKDWQEIDDRYFWHSRYRHTRVGEYISKMRGGVLDLGCGIGYMTYYCFDEGLYTGVDISEVAIKKARVLFPRASFKVHDITKKLPFPDNSFDNVVCSETIEHLGNFKPLLKEIKRVAIDKILITVPVSMGEADHVWPVWEYDDLIEHFSDLGKILTIERVFHHHYNLIWIQK